MMMQAKGAFFVALFIVYCSLVSGYSVKVINNVAPCSNGNYDATIKLFWANYAQQDINRGDSMVLDSSQIPDTGLGIQENGEYCRCCGNEAGCNNPDNAGMQLVITNSDNCAFQLNDPFYCGAHPPNAKNIVNVVVTSQNGVCVVELTRKDGAPNCQYSC